MRFLTILLTSSLLAPATYAFTQKGEQRVSNPQLFIKTATKEGLGASKIEKQMQKSLGKMKKNKPKEFQANLDNSRLNADQYANMLTEVKDGSQKISQAKVIAKYALLQAIRQNKSYLQNSIMNESGTDQWKAMESILKQRLNTNTYYVPSRRKTKNFNFQVTEWGRVSVSPDLKKAQWFLDVASRYDSNRLDPHAKNIQIAPSGGGFNSPTDSGFDELSVPEPQTETPAPPLAKGLKRSETLRSQKK